MSSSPSEALPRNQRIAKRREIVRIYDEGTRQYGRHAVVFARANELGHPRIAVTATRRIGKAHVRNRLRRWAREVYRRNREAMGIGEAAIDFVVNLKGSAAEAGFEEFSRDLVGTIRRSADSIRRRNPKG